MRPRAGSASAATRRRPDTGAPAVQRRATHGSPRKAVEIEGFRERVYAWIRRIPRGKVATYGQIAALAGAPRNARRVGQALGSAPGDLPWQRVINAQGRVSARAPRPDRGLGAREAEQERLLKAEGVAFVRGRTDLARYRWRPRAGATTPFR